MFNNKDKAQELETEMDKGIKSIVGLKAQIAVMNDEKDQLEERIYESSMQNVQRQAEKDSLLQLIPHVCMAVQGRPNRLRNFLEAMDNEGCKNRIIKVLMAQKVPIK